MCSEDNGIGVAVYQILVCVTLWHMSIGTRIIVAISFQEVDGTPDTQASAQGNNEGLKNGNSRVEKFHK